MCVVTVTKILYSTSGVETWITSDGRAYFVRLQESSQTERTTVDPDNEDERSDGVSVNFCCHILHILKLSSIQRIPKLAEVRGMKTKIFHRITWVLYKMNIVGRGLASITSKFLDGCKSLAMSTVTGQVAEALSITNHVEL